MTHAELQEMLGLYALGALEAEDAAELAAHLGTCASCREELGELERTAAELARAAEPLQPSGAVTREILEAVHSEPRLLPGPSIGTLNARRRGVRRRRPRLVGLAAGIMAVAIVLLVVSDIGLRSRLERTRHMLARGRELVEFIASPDVTTVPLRALESAPAARAFVAYDRRSGRGILFAVELPPPPPDRVYQLWAISEGFRPALVFSPDARGGTLVEDRWSPERRETPLFGITLEPAGGGREPTGPFLFLGAASRPPLDR